MRLITSWARSTSAARSSWLLPCLAQLSDVERKRLYRRGIADRKLFDGYFRCLRHVGTVDRWAESGPLDKSNIYELGPPKCIEPGGNDEPIRMRGTVTALGQSFFDNDVVVYAFVKITDFDGGRTMVEARSTWTGYPEVKASCGVNSSESRPIASRSSTGLIFGKSRTDPGCLGNNDLAADRAGIGLALAGHQPPRALRAPRPREILLRGERGGAPRRRWRSPRSRAYEPRRDDRCITAQRE